MILIVYELGKNWWRCLNRNRAANHGRCFEGNGGKYSALQEPRCLYFSVLLRIHFRQICVTNTFLYFPVASGHVRLRDPGSCRHFLDI